MSVANKNMGRTWAIGGIVAAPIVTIILAVFSALWVASVATSDLKRSIETTEARVADHEQRVRLVERDLTKIGTDLRWIRAAMEKRGGK